MISVKQNGDILTFCLTGSIIDKQGATIMSDFLFATPKMIDGIASVIDLFGVYTMYNDSATPEEADFRAYTADVQAMYADMNAVTHILDTECQKEAHM